MPLQPKEFMLYYAAALVVALLVFMRRRPRKGMLLRLRGGMKGSGRAEGRVHGDGAGEALAGKQPPENFTHIRAKGERPLNVVFNYNGHSWDAYEVLGLPAGSSPENVEAAFQEQMAKVDTASKPFMQAAHLAITSQWDTYRKAGGA